MLISVKTMGSILIFVCAKRSVSDRQLKKMVKKVQVKVVKCTKNKYWVPRYPPWALKGIFSDSINMFHGMNQEILKKKQPYFQISVDSNFTFSSCA